MSDSGSLLGKIPPHHDEAEKATLGAVLQSQEALGVVLEQLRPDDFYKTAHQRIFSAVVELSEQGERADLITLTEQLRKMGYLEKCGGSGYISELTSSPPTVANVSYYAEIVREQSTRRKLLNVAHDIVSKVHDPENESRILMEDVEKQMFEVSHNQYSGGYKKAGEIIAQTIDIIENIYRTKQNYTGVPSGLSDLDNLTSGFQNSEFIIIGARPSVGKTALALTMASNIAIHQKIPTGFFTLEMADMALMQRLIAMEARLRSDKIRNGMLKMSDFQKLTEAASRIFDAPLYICDFPNMKLLDLRVQARRMKANEKIEIMFVDYIGLIEPENKSSIPRHEQVAEVSRSLKALARELEIPIVCLSQVGRQSEGKEPNLADLRESGSIEQDADVVLFLHRDRGEKDGTMDSGSIETRLIVAKQRNGPVGTLDVVFLPSYTKFESLSREHQ